MLGSSLGIPTYKKHLYIIPQNYEIGTFHFEQTLEQVLKRNNDKQNLIKNKNM